ncbi:phosphopyruvate hydratase [Candidatus Roizmanbacteria bacterium]|jgi:enolase|nr:phosphopyruvate hydratase [Candidatus Roizmanbacteria bacterium]
MAKIKKIKARQIIDSRGYPTLEGRLWLDNDTEVITSIPSGSTVGKYEAVELRDHDPGAYGGNGVGKAVSFVNDLIAPKLVGIAPEKLKEIDYWLIGADGTKNKNRLGANTTLLISQLMVKAGAKNNNLPVFQYVNALYQSYFSQKIKIERIPIPIFNIINGAKYANNDLDFQEFQIIPSSSLSFSDGYKMGINIYHQLKKVLEYRNTMVAVGEEGGFAPPLSANVDAVEVLVEAVNNCDFKLGKDLFLGIDVAASTFYRNERYSIKDKPQPLTAEQLTEFLLSWVKTYSFLMVEDPLDQDDWDNWKKINKQMKEDLYIVGDDLIASNKERLEKAIKEEVCSTVLIKPNQTGTITETMEIIDISRKNNFSYIISHRSGETNDDFIADLAVGVQSDFVKFGAPARGERVAKYNRLLEIESDGLINK